MKRLHCFRVLSFFLSCLLLFSCVKVSISWDSPEKPGESPFVPPKTERFVLNNGLTVIFLSDPELPLVRGSIYFRGGSLIESQKGLVGAMGSLMRGGGAGNRSADELDKDLEKLASSINSSFGQEFGNISFSCVKSTMADTLGLVRDVMLKPRFEERRLRLWQSQTLDSIKRRREGPNTIANIAFAQVLYEGTPYGRVLLSEDVKKIKRGDLIKAHKRYIRPEGAYLAFTGDLTLDEAKLVAEKYFGNWSSSSKADYMLPPVDTVPSSDLFFIEGPFQQATVIAGQLGVPRQSPDQFAIDVANTIFGGTDFGSRLMVNIRGRLGLVYSIFGAIIPGAVKGRNIIYFQTKSDSIAGALKGSINELERFRREPVSIEELEQAKESLVNSFIFKFDSTDNLVERKASLELLGYPTDFDDLYMRSIQAMTASDVLQVAKERWDPAKFTIVVVGDKSALDQINALSLEENSVIKNKNIRIVQFNEALTKPHE